ncbi:bifunctional hydroxymethylpyrimidine kinase/phosphomethylpyrimidine kinase [Neptuniibacter sp. CAU 1671]|uniref:bifunctional hydroxymethylpyrimidine kinase/phosphomethylpyrimidine kinase n=1 Tax=Neptuniibacter sp. CAU 1671 TaxID=3032593 RepID=UPI0023DB5400|nr:bifunctional hydroxymethylpyrimidine kinase/phosphomethylpyrimidine kinase [Neptuniibacter sp. CAU 1671]MDF2183076.1 bifunctional hydroxymethylpyrimidine kinase/phosphomethylpyrimidine kinase [Neptuniibacter sp. CAU 1671]
MHKTSSSHLPNVLTIAGSDSGGGAGIQADLKTISALGGYGCSVITAITAQNTQGVSASEVLSPKLVNAQLKAVLDDLGISAIKTGMMGNAAVIQVVAAYLKEHFSGPVVVDPVMVASSGDSLLETAAVNAYLQELIPLATLITPNLPEAAKLLDQPVPDSIITMKQRAGELYELGAKAVLLKGGHLDGDLCTDVLFDGREFHLFEAAKLNSANTHGTGCTLASAIATGLAKGLDLAEAVSHAKHYVTEAIRYSNELNVGSGHGPVNHFYARSAER